MRKVIYLVIYPDRFEQIVDIFFSLQSLADRVGVSLTKMQYIIDHHILKNNRYYEQIYD